MTTQEDKMPTHVAIIPDGNRRWAKERGQEAFYGHQKGISAFHEVANHAVERGIEHLSLWGMSLDNLTKRSVKEVTGLLRIFSQEFKRLAESEDIHSNKTRIRVFGRWQERFPVPVKRAIEGAIDATSHYDRHFLNLFLVYNGTDEMLQAVKDIVKERETGSAEVTVGDIKNHLFTKDLPPVDLVIRTAGDPHLSNGFMMWDAADAELFFTDVFWPDFSKEEFDRALAEYSVRRRRLGT